MSDAILVAIITSTLSLLGVIVTVKGTNRRNAAEMNATLDKAQAITNTKLEELTREVREHNNFARRVPLVEQKLENIEKRLDKAGI